MDFDDWYSQQDIFPSQLEAARAAWQAAQPAAPAVPKLHGCECRFDAAGRDVEQCKFHGDRIEALHEWAERAKTAEKALKQAPALRELSIAEAWDLWVSLPEEPAFDMQVELFARAVIAAATNNQPKE